jgi:hypothetical protein
MTETDIPTGGKVDAKCERVRRLMGPGSRPVPDGHPGDAVDSTRKLLDVYAWIGRGYSRHSADAVDSTRKLLDVYAWIGSGH